VRDNIMPYLVISNMESLQALGLNEKELITVIEYVPDHFILVDGNHRIAAHYILNKGKDFKITAEVLAPVL
jgi:FKBP-type peptidyl-prolyl cis-trans isomerase 2